MTFAWPWTPNMDKLRLLPLITSRRLPAMPVALTRLLFTLALLPATTAFAAPNDPTDQLRAFQGPVLVMAYPYGAPWKWMKDQSAESTEDSYVLVMTRSLNPDPDVPDMATVRGALGDATFHRALEPAGATSCELAADYCAWRSQLGDGVPNEELFRNLTVGEKPAVAHRVRCCAQHLWEVTWFDADANVSYTLEVVGSTPWSSPSSVPPSKGNRQLAQYLADLANSGLIVLP